MRTPRTQKRLLTLLLTLVALALVGVVAGSALFLVRGTQPEFVFATRKQHFVNFSFSPDGTKLLGAGWDAPAQLWDLSTGTPALNFPSNAVAYHLAFASDGRTFALGKADTTVTHWNLAGERQNPVGYHHSYISGLAYSPDGKWLASSGHSDCTTRIWEADTGKRVRDLKGHHRWAGAVAFSPDSQLLATGDWGSVRLWDVHTGQLNRRLQMGTPIHLVAFSPDGKTVIGGGSYGSLAAWEVATGKPVPGFTPPLGGVSHAVFTPDGKYIIAQQSTRICLLDATTGRSIVVLVGESWQDKLPLWLRRNIPALQPPPHPDLFAMALSPDGKRLAYSTEKEIRVIPCNFR